MRYTHTIKDFNSETGYATVVYTADRVGLPVVETGVYFGSDYGKPEEGIAVAKNAPIAYWASIEPPVYNIPTNAMPFSVDASKQPKPQ